MTPKIIICGSREWDDYKVIHNRIDKLADEYPDVTIVTGGARGADEIAHEYAVAKGLNTIVVPANWRAYGKSAGPIRNRVMLEMDLPNYPVKVIAFRLTPESRGTNNMIDQAQAAGVPVEVVEPSTAPSGG